MKSHFPAGRAVAFPALTDGPSSPASLSHLVSLSACKRPVLTTQVQLISLFSCFIFLHSSCHHLIYYMLYFIYLLSVPPTPTLECKLHEGRDVSSFCSLAFSNNTSPYKTSWGVISFSVVWKTLYHLEMIRFLKV